MISWRRSGRQGCFEQDGCFAFLCLPLLAGQHSMISDAHSENGPLRPAGLALRKTGTNGVSPLHQVFCSTVAEM
jgi:hypothetical protein